MASPRSNLKIRPDHLDRPAFVYVRQSTLFQVRENTASTARQYDLVQRAQDLGWSRTSDHRHRSGSGTLRLLRGRSRRLPVPDRSGRAGPGRRRPQPGSLPPGPLLQRLVSLAGDLCPDRHPGHRRGRRLRPQPVCRPPAARHPRHHERGRTALAPQPPARRQTGPRRTGRIADASARSAWSSTRPAGWSSIPTRKCSRPSACCSPLFEQTGSALAVVKHFGEHSLLFPDRLWGKARDGELLWKPLRHGRVLDVLHNPRYAGAYVYGRTQTRTRTLPDENAAGQGPDATRGRCRLADRASQRPPGLPQLGAVPPQPATPRRQLHVTRSDRRGAVREGHALLQGSCCAAGAADG